MKTVAKLTILGLALFVAWGLYYRVFIGPKRILHGDRVASVWERKPLFRYLAFHSSIPKTATILDRDIHNVRGDSPYYLRSTNLDLVILAQNLGFNEVIWVVELDTARFHRIEGSRGFGWSIGLTNSSDEPFSDYIISASKHEVVLGTTFYDGRRQRIHIDLTSDRITSVDEKSEQ